MSDIVVGSVVEIIDNLYEDDRYEVLELNNEQARIRGLNPTSPVFWIDLDDLEAWPETKEEVIAEWRRLHDHSGI